MSKQVKKNPIKARGKKSSRSKRTSNKKSSRANKKSKRSNSSPRTTKSGQQGAKRASSIKNKDYYYIFDANFFISLKHVKATSPLKHLKKVRDEIGINFLISDMVFNEIPFMHGARENDFRKAILVQDVSETDLNKVKFDLNDVGITENRHAQDPDLTLIALALKYSSMKPNAKIHIVSDDFKLSENLKALNYPIEFLSLSAFLLYLAKHATSPGERSYFKSVRDAVLKYTLSYMLERHEQYNAQSKLLWLIEKAVSVAEDGEIGVAGIQNPTGSAASTSSISHSSMSSRKNFKNISVKDLEKEDAKSSKLMKMCTKYIQTKNLPFEQLDKIVLMLPLLDEIISSKKTITVAKKYLEEDNTEKALNSLRTARKKLMYSLQKAGSLLPYDKYNVFQKVVCIELSNCEFLRSILYIGLNKIDNALESLNSTAMFATMGKIVSTVLAINYLKAIIYVFNSRFDDAAQQYRFTANLAVNYDAGDLLLLKCRIGEAITLFLSGFQNDALLIIDSINNSVEGQNIENKLTVFEELGDYFYTISNPKLAISLYREALECAVDDDRIKWKSKLILSKMKRAYMNAMLDQGTDNKETNIDTLIDTAHELKNIDEFNKYIAELSKFNAMLYSENLKYTPKGKKQNYYDIEPVFRERYDVVDILESGETTVLIAFNESVGLLGFRVKLPRKLHGMPENYSIQLNKNANVQIIKPSNSLKAKYLLRGIIVVKAENLIIERQIPVFFQQIKL